MPRPTARPAARVTLTTIARDLGVSPATVSNAFNRPDQLSPALRRRVLDHAAGLGFAGPDATARSLRRGRTGAIGVPYNDLLSYAFADPAFTTFLTGLAEVIEAEGMAMLLIPGAPWPAVDPGAVRDALIDAFVIYSMAATDPVVVAALARRLPTVTVDGPRTAGVPHVGIDDRAAAAGMAAHLTALGHRRVGIVSLHLARDRQPAVTTLAAARSAEQELIRERLVGYADGLAGAGVGPETVPVVACEENTEAHGERAAADLLARDPGITALIAMSDRLAIGALAAARAAGRRVPGDLSVAGFDGIPAGAATDPALTTVTQPHGDKGRAAGRALLARQRGEDVADVILPASLTVRRSTGPASPH